MPTSLSEWSALIGISLVAGVACGVLFKRRRWLVIGLAALQVVAAPAIYYMPPVFAGIDLAEYYAWSFLIIPMLAVQSFALSLLSAWAIRRVLRFVRERQNI